MCRLEKPFSEFHRRGGGFQTRCKPCALQTAKESYQRNKAQVIQRTKAQVRRKKAFVASLKDKPCLDCGRRLPLWAMQFDHVQGKKGEALSRMGPNNRTEARILMEAAKCEVVCVLCHRDRTMRRGKYAIIHPDHEQMVQKWRQQ